VVFYTKRGEIQTGFLLNRGIECRLGFGYEKARFLPNILLYLGNYTTQDHSYCGRPIETRSGGSNSAILNDI